MMNVSVCKEVVVDKIMRPYVYREHVSQHARADCHAIVQHISYLTNFLLDGCVRVGFRVFTEFAPCKREQAYVSK